MKIRKYIFMSLVIFTSYSCVTPKTISINSDGSASVNQEYVESIPKRSDDGIIYRDTKVEKERYLNSPAIFNLKDSLEWFVIFKIQPLDSLTNHLSGFEPGFFHVEMFGDSLCRVYTTQMKSKQDDRLDIIDHYVSIVFEREILKVVSPVKSKYFKIKRKSKNILSFGVDPKMLWKKNKYISYEITLKPE